MPRPRKDPAKAKSAQVSLRLPAALRAQLDAARRAVDPERPLNQEIEIRLRLSFEENEKLKKQFGELNFWLFKSISRLIRNIESERCMGRRWYEDPYTHKQVRLLIATMLDHFKPQGRAVAPRQFRGMVPDLGEQIAVRELASIETALQDDLGNNYWPHAAEWFAAAAVLTRKMTKKALPTFFRHLEKKS